MINCNTEDFREKEVVNICDGRKLGVVVEIEFDMAEGKLTAIVVSGECGFFGKSKNEVIIPWCRIDKIGEDIILVNADGIITPPEPKKCCGRKGKI